MKSMPAIREIWDLLRRIKLNPVLFLVPVVLSMAAAALEGVSLGLLIPLLKGAVALDFSFARETAYAGPLLGFLPSLSRNDSVSIFMWLVAIIFSAALMKNALKYFSAISAAYISRIARHKLRRLVFRHYMTFGKLYFDQHSLGYLNQVLMAYTDQVAKPIIQGYQLINTFFSLAVYLTIMLTISWPLTLLVMVLVPMMNYSMKMLMHKIRLVSHESVNSMNMFSKQTFNILSIIPLVKSYTNETQEEKRFASLSDRVARLEFTLDRGRQLIGPVQESITLVVVLLVVSGMAWLGTRGQTDVTASLLVFFYVLMNAAGTYGGVNRFWGTVSEVAGPLSEVKGMLADRGKFAIRGGWRQFGGLTRAIELRSVRFTYPNGREVLHGVSFVMTKGAMTALVGPTGAGKSTIIHLLMRLFDSDGGQVLFDGVDVSEFELGSLRSHMALVSQDTQLFNDTLANNITYALENVSKQKLREVVRAARLEEFVERLPQGLATEIGDRGVQLSGGEKQRVSIARALLKEAEILILDEATSSLDTKTEQLIQEAIDEAVRDKTAIVIAHRLSTIMHADNIVVLDEGRVVEQGSRDDLLKSEGVFYEMWQAQKFH